MLKLNRQYEAKSLKKGFKDLTIDEQAEALCYDALTMPDSLMESKLPESYNEEYYKIIDDLNSRNNLREDIKRYISLLKRTGCYEDYQILSGCIYYACTLGMSREELCKEYLIKPYLRPKLIEAPKNVDPAEKEHPEDDKPEDIKMIEAPKQKKEAEAPKHKKQENKQDSVKQKAVTKGAAKDMNGNITATDILNSCNAHSQQHKMQQAKTVEHGPNCNCGHCGEQNNNQVPQVHPELTLDKKVELLKSHIDFSVIKNFTVKEWEVDNLLQFVESPILKQKLREMGSACNPDFPKLTMSKKYKFDKNLYKFAFYAETNDKNKVIVVLYNTHMTLNPQFGLCNEMAFTLAPANHVK